MASTAIGDPALALQAGPTEPVAAASATVADSASTSQNAGDGQASATDETPPTAGTGPANDWVEGAAASVLASEAARTTSTTVSASEDVAGAPENGGSGGGEDTSGGAAAANSPNAESGGISATVGKENKSDRKENGGVAGPASQKTDQGKQLRPNEQPDRRSNEAPATTKTGTSKASPARSASMGPQASGAAMAGGTRKGRWALKNQVGVAQPHCSS